MRSTPWETLSRALCTLAFVATVAVADEGAVDPRVGRTIYRELVAPPGAAPFRSIRVFRVDDAKPPHWLFLTEGLHTQATRGELSVRTPFETQPPAWAPSLLLYLASYASRANAEVAPPAFVDLAGPDETDAPGFAGAVMVADPVLLGKPVVDAIIGLTEDELMLVESWSGAAWADTVRLRNPLFVSAAHRPSLLANAAFATEVRSRAAREGSSLEALAMGHCVCVRRGGGVVLELATNGVRGLIPVLPGRVGLGRPLRLISDDGVVVLSAGTTITTRLGEPCTITLPPAVARELATRLRSQVGELRIAPGLFVHVVPGKDANQTGKEAAGKTGR